MGNHRSILWFCAWCFSFVIRDIRMKLKDKKFSDLNIGKKILFFSSFIIMIIVLVYVGFNFKDFNNRIDTIKEPGACEYTFKNGILEKVECPDNIMINNTELIGNYTLVDYYDDRKQTTNDPFENFTFN